MLKQTVLLLTLLAVVNNVISIIGGKESNYFFHPYTVSLRIRANAQDAYEHKCGGSIYLPHVIITAAQCLADLKDGDRLMIVAAANTRTGDDGELYPVEEYFIHPNYTFWTMDYDLGIVILKDPLDLSRSDLSAIPLREERPATGSRGQIIGWGFREENGVESYKLQQAEVPIISQEDCGNSHGSEEITERMICAGYLKWGAVDACRGDNGGPLIVNGELVGLSSWGRGCGRPEYPGVYTFPGNLKKWIDDTILGVQLGKVKK